MLTNDYTGCCVYDRSGTSFYVLREKIFKIAFAYKANSSAVAFVIVGKAVSFGFGTDVIFLLES